MIDLVCSVVDNYGDIAVVWRLAQSLLEENPSLRLRLLVDDWQAFAQLCPDLDPAASRQELVRASGSVVVLRTPALHLLEDERAQPADVLIEAFGAPTPVVWLEPFLTKAAEGSGVLRERVILHLEYLTAETWSEQYHLLPSPVGRPGVQRFFFVPGFRPRTGGLVFADPPVPAAHCAEDWQITLFSYEHNYDGFWTELADVLQERGQSARVLVCAGRSQPGALAGWEKLKRARVDLSSIRVEALPFLDQDSYTALLAASDFNVVRGEESWVQAVLSGKPFLWQAYLQPEGYQSVKVDAFLEVWRPWFEAEGQEALTVFVNVAAAFRAINLRLTNSEIEPLFEGYRVFWENHDLLERVGRRWADDLRKNAKLSRRMLEFLESFRV